MRKILKNLLKHEAVRQLIECVYCLVVTYGIGHWAIVTAHNSRGYDAVGGEYILILAVYLIAWVTIHKFLEELEVWINGSNRRKKRRG